MAEITYAFNAYAQKEDESSFRMCNLKSLASKLL